MEKRLDEEALAGKRILITRARGQSAQFAADLRARGAEVIEFPTIEIHPPVSWKGVDQAIARVKSYDWLIFTSANGVHFFFERLEKKKEDFFLPSSLKICAIGPATADRLKDKGIRVDYTPKEFVAESILRGFKRMTLRGRRILLARAKEARDVLPKGLERMGGEVDVVEVYRTVRPRRGAERLKRLLEDGPIDVVTFTSSSTVNHFVELLKKEDLKKLLDAVSIASIGPITTRTAKGWGMKVRIQPKEYTIPALTREIVKYFSKRTPHLKGKRLETRKVHEPLSR